MNELHYADIIAADKEFTALADLGKRFGTIDMTLFMHQFIDLVPDEHLYLLAEKWSVTAYDGWSLAQTPTQQRALIKSAYKLHALKGTPWAIRHACRVLGFGEVEIIEGLSNHKHNSKITQRNGLFCRGEKNKWAYYIVRLNKAISNTQAERMRLMLNHFAPARCVLAALDYRAVQFLHNNEIKQRNGMYNRGAA